jgi:chromosome segregation ATPase
MDNTSKNTTTSLYERYEKQLEDWSERISSMKGQVADLTKDAQEEAIKELDTLVAKYNTAKERIGEIKSKGPRARDQLQSGFERSWQELTHSFENIKRIFH